MESHNKKYTDRTPISDIIPDNLRLQSEAKVQNQNTYLEIEKSQNIETPHHQQFSMLPQKQSTNENMLEDLFDDLENDKLETTNKDNESFIDIIKKYAKVIIILAVIFLIISSGYTLGLFDTYAHNMGLVVTKEAVVPTTSGLLVQGGMLGIIYVLVDMLLAYITIS